MPHWRDQEEVGQQRQQVVRDRVDDQARAHDALVGGGAPLAGRHDAQRHARRTGRSTAPPSAMESVAGNRSCSMSRYRLAELEGDAQAGCRAVDADRAELEVTAGEDLLHVLAVLLRRGLVQSEASSRMVSSRAGCAPRLGAVGQRGVGGPVEEEGEGGDGDGHEDEQSRDQPPEDVAEHEAGLLGPRGWGQVTCGPMGGGTSHPPSGSDFTQRLAELVSQRYVTR